MSPRASDSKHRLGGPEDGCLREHIHLRPDGAHSGSTPADGSAMANSRCSQSGACVATICTRARSLRARSRGSWPAPPPPPGGRQLAETSAFPSHMRAFPSQKSALPSRTSAFPSHMRAIPSHMRAYSLSPLLGTLCGDRILSTWHPIRVRGIRSQTRIGLDRTVEGVRPTFVTRHRG